MDNLLILASIADWIPDWIIWLGSVEHLLIVLKVLVGLGLVIFVHELGHFAVAKWCGVQCDKFYVGFDVPIKLGWGRYGIKLPQALWKRKWGETEYGIGILPLGGYVKMLGQDDNPARAAEEIERAKLEAADGGETASTGGDGFVLNPRSYLAKSVPQRMAIISAGVIMNVIFALVFAVIAFTIGVPQMPSVIGTVTPGEAAWRSGKIRPDDRVVEVKGHPVPTFTKLAESVVLSNAEEGIPVTLLRHDPQRGRDETIELRLYPDNSRRFTFLGVQNSPTTTLLEKTFLIHGSPADRSGGFRGGDTIVAINGEPITTYGDYHRRLALNFDKPLTYTLRRAAKPTTKAGEAGQGSNRASDGDSNGAGVKDAVGKNAANETGELATVTVEPNRRKSLGIVMKLDKIAAVQDGSPAAAAGLRAGDVLVEIDGLKAADIDPMTLGDVLRAKAIEKPGRKIPVVVSRDDAIVRTEAVLRFPDWFEIPSIPNFMVSAPALGIAYKVPAVVDRIDPNGPAAKADLRAGDTIVQAAIVPTDASLADEKENGPYGIGKHPMEIGETQAGWALVLARVQHTLPDTAIRLTVERGDAKHDVTLIPAAAGLFNPDRGIHLEALRVIRQAESALEALQLGADETLHSLTVVFRFLRKVAEKPETGFGVGGPITIATAAGMSAKEGMASLLMFLTMISANLAVINFLPIPVLDGGHMVFLLYEGIRGKPADERVMAGLQWSGLLLLLSLMIFVFGLDLGILSRH